MTSGKRTTAEDIYHVQRLASYKNSDGQWMFTWEDIGQRLSIDPRTVRNIVREAARSWHQLTRWKRDFPTEG